jgi:hypothetical protein
MPCPFQTLSWDIFCTVIDNYGDIGVAWRLARRLAHDFGYAVRLWVDDLASFSRIAPLLEPAWPARCWMASAFASGGG